MSRLKDCSFSVNGIGSKVIIGNGCVLTGLSVHVSGDNTFVEIKDNVRINASKRQPTIIAAIDGGNVIIGEGCLFSNSIEFHTSDYHCMYDLEGNNINPPKDIVIGDHVWIGLRTTVLKGTRVASDNVIGACSLVNKVFEEEHTVIAGNPAVVKKHFVNWSC